jgi:hypothetical protein
VHASSSHLHTSAASEIAVGKADGNSTAIETTRATSEHDPIAQHRHVSHRVSQDGNDLESASPPEYNDPYHLSAAIKPESELALIRANTSRKRDGCGPITLNRKARSAKKLEEFYSAQNENIERLLNPSTTTAAPPKKKAMPTTSSTKSPSLAPL